MAVRDDQDQRCARGSSGNKQIPRPLGEAEEVRYSLQLREVPARSESGGDHGIGGSVVRSKVLGIPYRKAVLRDDTLGDRVHRIGGLCRRSHVGPAVSAGGGPCIGPRYPVQERPRGAV